MVKNQSDQPRRPICLSVKKNYAHMKKTFFLLLLLLLAFAFGCDKDAILPDNLVRFDQMEVGQKSRYLRFQGGSCSVNNPTLFKYLPDTLVLEVTAKDGDVYRLKEYLTPGSLSSVYPDSIGIGGGSSEITFKLKIADGEIALFEPAQDFFAARLFINRALTFPLEDIAMPELNISFWYPASTPTYEPMGYVKNYEQLGVSYPRLNVVLDYGPMASDGPGAFHLYAPEHGIVRSGYRSGWCNAGWGWDLLPKQP